jgi:hypothetical protein
MAPFAVMPDWLGLNIWNLLNALLLFWAIWSIKDLENRKKILVLWVILLELLTSIQNSQSNGLMAAFMILAFNAFENRKTLWAALFICLSIYVKVFGFVLILLTLLYKDRVKFLVYFFAWQAVLFILPLIFISFDQLIVLYGNWLNLLSTDHSASMGLSVMGWLDTWFGLTVHKNVLSIIGFILLLLPFIILKQNKLEKYKLILFTSILIWVVIFNHKAESPTYIIAMCGIAIWYFSQPKTAFNLSLLIMSFIFISLSPTDLFPTFLRKNYVAPYVLKAVPTILIWIVIQYQLLSNNAFLLRRNKIS